MKRNSLLAIIAGLAVAAAIAQANEPATADESYEPESTIFEEYDEGGTDSVPGDLSMWVDRYGLRDTFGIMD